VSRVFNCVLLAYAQVLDGSIGAELVRWQVVAQQKSEFMTRLLLLGHIAHGPLHPC
jgi:hypothetical protein